MTINGRHAAEQKVSILDSWLAMYKLTPIPDPKYGLNLYLARAGLGYGIDVLTLVDGFKRRQSERVNIWFSVDTATEAAEVMRGLVKAWVWRRVPATPNSRKHANLWRTYVDATAAAVNQRCVRASDRD